MWVAPESTIAVWDNATWLSCGGGLQHVVSTKESLELLRLLLLCDINAVPHRQLSNPLFFWLPPMVLEHVALRLSLLPSNSLALQLHPVCPLRSLYPWAQQYTVSPAL